MEFPSEGIEWEQLRSGTGVVRRIWILVPLILNKYNKYHKYLREVYGTTGKSFA